MGNEMGNNNTSGFQEESNTAAEAPHESLQEPGHADDLKAGNHESFTNSVSDDPKVGDDQKSVEGDQEAEVLPPSKGTDKALQESLEHDDSKSSTTRSAESEQSHQKVVNSASDDPKTAEDAHGERDQEEIEVPPPSISNAADSPKTPPEEDHINLQTEINVYLEKEESNTTAEAPQNSLLEAGHADDVKAENHENCMNSASDDPKEGDNHVGDQKSGEGEQEAQVLPPSKGTEEALQESLEHDDSKSNTTRSAESEQSHQKVENSASVDPKTEQEETAAENHVAPPTESKGCDEQVVRSTLDDPTEVDLQEIEVHLPKTFPNEVVHDDDMKQEDDLNLQTETKIYLEKGLNLATDDSKELGDAYVDNQISSSDAGSINCRENRVSSLSDSPEVVGDAPIDDQNSGKGVQKESQVHHPTNSNELEKSMESNEEVMNLDSDLPMQERDPSANSKTSGQETEAEAAESLKVAVESNGGNVGLEENRFGVEGFLFEQTSINKAADEEGTAPNPQKSGDIESHQHESPEVLGKPESNNMLLQIDISNNQSGSVAPTKEVSSEEEVSDFLSQTIALDTPKGAFGNCNEDLSTKMTLERTDSSESLPEEKCMVLTQETKLVSKEPPNQEIKVSKTSEAASIVIESNQETNEELVEQFTNETAAVTSQSPDNAASIVEPVLEMKLIAKPARDLPPLAARAAEIKIPGNGQCAREEASRFSSGSSGAQSGGRSSTESNPEIHSQMRKSPSFSLDLLTEARAEETEQAEVSLGNPNVHNGEEERDVKPEASDSEKLRTPFLGFLKDKQGKNTVITQNAQENHIAMKPSTKEVMSSSAKAKSKRKPRPFLFGTCICCAAVIN